MATDSTAMTIDFLRARLLSERSVSRAARERADQLAQRVVELEEQLRIVTTQRKKAEKATAEVLAILESQGVDYLSDPEGIDSSSDQDEVGGGKPTNSAIKEQGGDGISVNSSSNSKGQDETSKSNGSTVERSEVEDAMSGSEVDGQVPAGGLSWKGRSKSPDSHKKHRAAKNLKQIRPRHIFYFTSPDPSPKYRMGKSCRKIKPKDLRSATEDEGERRLSDGNDKGEGEDRHENEQTGFYIEVAGEGNEMRTDVNEKEGEMERALEEQAQLIDQFQAEENAQREWEMMYSQNRSDDFEPENKASISECICHNKEEIVDNMASKMEIQDEASAIPENLYSTEYACITAPVQKKSDPTYEKAIVILSEGIMQTDSLEDDLILGNDNNEIESPKQVKSVPDDSPTVTTKEPSGSVVLEHNQQHFSSDKDSSFTHDSDFVDQFNKNVIISIPNTPTSQSSRSNSSQTREENPLALQLYEPPSESCHKSTCSKVEDVLESLRCAKATLRENLSKKYPLHDHQLLAITDRPHAEMDSHLAVRGNTPLETQSMNIPVGSSSGLFRLPTDSFPKPGISDNFLSLEYPSIATNRLLMNSSGGATEDYLRTQLLLDLPSAYSGSNRYDFGSSSNLASEMASSLPNGMSRFYEDLRTTLPARERFFLYGGDPSFSDRRIL